MSDSELFPGPTNSIGGYREFLAALVMIVFTLLAILIYLQASDLNPLLLYKPYADWLNSNVLFSKNHPNLGLLWIFGCIVGSCVTVILGGYAVNKICPTSKS
jgi:hypothetical protein